MRLFQRPEKPADFEEKMVSYRQKVEEASAAGDRPNFKSREAWRKYKGAFAEVQHDKCAYCETNAQAGQHGDVEHFRPKSHYPWLAYSWENWLLSCELCNRHHKKDAFPVTEVLPLAPGAEEKESPLLLDPCGEEAPARHLQFNQDGSVEAKTEMGRQSIRVLGLDRPALVRLRARLTPRLRQTILSLGLEHENHRWRDLQAMAADDAELAGMIRIIVEQELGLSWEDLIEPGLDEFS